MSKSRYSINPLCMIVVPTLEKHPLSWQWHDAMMSLQFPLGAAVSRLRVHGKIVDEARNDGVQAALDANADYVLFLGDDVLPPANTFELLRRHREHLVTGVYWTKQYPPKPYLWNGFLDGPHEDWKAGEYFPVDWAGVDCLLAHTDVFRAMEPPWFSRDYLFEDGQVEPTANATEDLYFYAKARQAGFKLYCDAMVQCEHQDRATGMTYGLRDDMPQAQSGVAVREPGTPAILVADIGAGYDSPFLGSNAQVVRYDHDASTRPDVQCDVRAIPCNDDHFDKVHARHVLEHFMPDEAPALIREWTRILKPGGELIINVPNLGYAAREILKAEDGTEVGVYPLWQIYGHQDGSPGELHKNGFTRLSLESLLRFCGLESVEVVVGGDVNENLLARAVKAPAKTAFVIGPAWREIEAAEADQRGRVAGDLERLASSEITPPPAVPGHISIDEAERANGGHHAPIPAAELAT